MSLCTFIHSGNSAGFCIEHKLVTETFLKSAVTRKVTSSVALVQMSRSIRHQCGQNKGVYIYARYLFNELITDD